MPDSMQTAKPTFFDAQETVCCECIGLGNVIGCMGRNQFLIVKTKSREGKD
jgi:hypothetical protein